MRVKVLVIPVYRRHWLYHTWVEDGSVDASLLAIPWYRAGDSIQDKWTALTAQTNHKMNNFVSEQWKLNAAAKKGTFRSWLHKLALTVLSREDPIETFVKKLPRASNTPAGQNMVLEVLYPPSLDPVLVRRRLRHIALRTTNTQRRALVGWTLATLPQSPLILTPFPNVTLYYTVYKTVSSYRALGGAATLQAAAENPASHTLQRILDEAEGGSQQHQGGGGPLGWARRRVQRSSGHHAAPEDRLVAILQRLGVKTSQQEPSTTDADKLSPAERRLREQLQQQARAAGRSKHGAPLVAYLPSNQLEDAVQPLDRWRTPLEDSVIGALAMHAPHWDLDGLTEHLQRVRNRALAAETKRDAERGRHAPPTPPPPYAVPAFSAASAGSTITTTGFGAHSSMASRTLPGLPQAGSPTQHTSAPYGTAARGFTTAGLVTGTEHEPMPRFAMAVASILPLSSSRPRWWGSQPAGMAKGKVPISLSHGAGSGANMSVLQSATSMGAVQGTSVHGGPLLLWGSNSSSRCMVRAMPLATKPASKGKAHELVFASITATVRALGRFGRA